MGKKVTFPIGAKVRVIGGGRTGRVVKRMKIDPPLYPLNDPRTATEVITILDSSEPKGSRIYKFPNTWLKLVS
jgi:hypothetical protein